MRALFSLSTALKSWISLARHVPTPPFSSRAIARLLLLFKLFVFPCLVLTSIRPPAPSRVNVEIRRTCPLHSMLIYKHGVVKGLKQFNMNPSLSLSCNQPSPNRNKRHDASSQRIAKYRRGSSNVDTVISISIQ